MFQRPALLSFAPLCLAIGATALSQDTDALTAPAEHELTITRATPHADKAEFEADHEVAQVRAEVHALLERDAVTCLADVRDELRAAHPRLEFVQERMSYKFVWDEDLEIWRLSCEKIGTRLLADPLQPNNPVVIDSTVTE